MAHGFFSVPSSCEGLRRAGGAPRRGASRVRPRRGNEGAEHPRAARRHPNARVRRRDAPSLTRTALPPSRR
ncbi:hypothetical protein SERN_1981 [Serinibacter arcticus]|uniref:Uncharacterized protein n=1 Tax=Serinibacter arcticus TaxID=1655435 RepID=A0A4Z1DZZ2_9MICO|nr:hypothetical protein SERN_1981 [Serinibacter arcticus]